MSTATQTQDRARWRFAIFASVVLWFAAIGGNAVLFAVHPASIGLCQRQSRRSRWPRSSQSPWSFHRLNRGSSLAGNVPAWRARTQPRGVALTGIASAAAATLLYPVWAMWLARVPQTRLA